MEELQARLTKELLAVITVPEKGRCLLTKKDFLPGQTILNQDPYVAVLDDESRGKRCDGCFIEFSSLKRCSACKYVWYCSSACQKKEWKVHQEECKFLVHLQNENSRVPTPTLQLMLRLLIKRRLQSQGSVAVSSTDNYNIVQALPTHFSENDEERLVLYAQMANLVKKMIQADDEDIKHITENFCRFSCNAHTICDDELRPLGTGLFPVVSIINHSCSPNSVLVFEGKHAVVRATKEIRRGSEITLSYVELGANTENRRNTLLKQYFFVCNCSRCSEEPADEILEAIKCPDDACDGFTKLDKISSQWRCIFCDSIRSPDEVKTLAAEAEALVKKGNQLQTSGNIKEAREIFLQAENLQKKLWHARSMPLMRTRDVLLKLHLSLEDWDSALSCCRSTVPAYETAYSPGYHPLLGLQLYTLGKLELHNGDAAAAVKALTRASDILSITHGSRGEFVRELSGLLEQAKAEAFQ